MVKYLEVNKHTCDKALELGYEKVPDANAYTGFYYIKDGKKWIFNIQALKKELGVVSDDDLRKENYDVDIYWILEKNTPSTEMQELYQDLMIESDEPVYLEGGMYLYPDGSIR
ncbi:hypothetical protein MKT39_016855 [Providencia rettgeri]|nr:hypothetical protein [Providencia rettgeri]